jgi:predicted acetyltransferase
MDPVIRPIEESEIGVFCTKLNRAFGGDPHDLEEETQRMLRVLDLDRSVCAFDGDDLIGTCAAIPFDLTVPGNALPMGGTTWVMVQSTHRRRGLLRAMMTAHLEEIRRRGEPLAGLWASESSIYGRFGYGLATEACEMELDAKAITFAGDPPPGEVRLVEADAARTLLPPIHELVRPTRPGALSRNEAWWEARIFADPEHRRKGRTTKRWAVYERDGVGEGYAIYRQESKWTPFPKGAVHVVELFAATPEAHEALWRFVTSIDLFPDVHYWNFPVDDELPWRVTDPRQVQRKPCDGMWLRLMDVSRALAGRSYAAEGRLVLGVSDKFLPDNDGSYELEAGPDGAQCRRTETEPDLEIPVEALGAVYLGTPRVTTLARAGLVRGSDEALALADRLFGWHQGPNRRAV